MLPVAQIGRKQLEVVSEEGRTKSNDMADSDIQLSDQGQAQQVELQAAAQGERGDACEHGVALEIGGAFRALPGRNAVVPNQSEERTCHIGGNLSVRHEGERLRDERLHIPNSVLRILLRHDGMELFECCLLFERLVGLVRTGDCCRELLQVEIQERHKVGQGHIERRANRRGTGEVGVAFRTQIKGQRRRCKNGRQHRLEVGHDELARLNIVAVQKNRVLRYRTCCQQAWNGLARMVKRNIGTKHGEGVGKRNARPETQQGLQQSVGQLAAKQMAQSHRLALLT
ncbi:hypothetical protein CAOG_009438 [Capsaspora owczarzaki ATCC 30864]|uniref:Uncharacterized protein n=1 Tax=Capsaspora owczarzaki (strain ATCC 30864) TaxID=595528 RepID=A0A0D2X154_CAPO3|nr:hypothetical protein CAOG_009438 [Capsaspora owczarzaki ATCC 30864]